MARRVQLTCPAWVVVPCVVLSFGLGYRYASTGRRANQNRKGSVVEGQPPHMSWKPGEKQPPPGALDTDHVRLDPATLKSCYSLIISAVVPRPIAFVTSTAPDGTVNLSPFSYFSAVGHDPPMLAFSVCRNGDGSKKDTLVNVEANGEFVVSIMSEWFVEAANHTCGRFPPDVDEMAVSGLTPAESTVVVPPRVKESAVNMECKVRHTYDIVNRKGKVTTTVVFGEVVMFHVFRHLVNEAGAGEGKPTVKLEGYKPISRLGGNTYALLGSVFDLARPSVK